MHFASFTLHTTYFFLLLKVCFIWPIYIYLHMCLYMYIALILQYILQYIFAVHFVHSAYLDYSWLLSLRICLFLGNFNEVGKKVHTLGCLDRHGCWSVRDPILRSWATTPQVAKCILKTKIVFWKNALCILLQCWRCSCKFRSRRIGSRIV
jgi:hypothetical protein